MRVFVDTSALLAILDGDDQRHSEASAAFAWLAAETELVTHNYIHVEAIAVAKRRLGGEAAQQLTDVLLPIMTTVWVDEALHREALAAQRAVPGSASFVDHVSFALMRRIAVGVAFAFDRDFEAQGFSRPSIPSQPRHRLGEQPAPYAGPDLVSVSEIAARAGRSINTVQSWRRRHTDFPAPLAQLGAGPIWNWARVQDWISARDRIRAA